MVASAALGSVSSWFSAGTEAWEQNVGQHIPDLPGPNEEVKNELDDYIEALEQDNFLYETGPESVKKEKWDKTDTDKIKTQWLKEIKEVEDNLEQYIGGS